MDFEPVVKTFVIALKKAVKKQLKRMFFNRSSDHKVHVDKICVLLRLGKGILSGSCPKAINVFYLLVDMRRNI